MPSRRSHTNSHHGCLECKARRVKCDQGQPACSRCAKKRQKCTYRHLMSSYDPFQNNSGPTQRARLSQSSRRRARHQPSPSTASTSPAPSSLSSSSSPHNKDSAVRNVEGLATLRLHKPSVPGLDPLTHQLLHHYTTSSSAFPAEPFRADDVFSTFAAAIDRHLFAHPYVHHAVLTYAALHLASVSPSSIAFSSSLYRPSTSSQMSPHLMAAFSHKASALATFRPVLESISSVNCEPALTASAILFSCAFALPMVSRSLAINDEQDPVNLLAQIISLFRGTVVIFRMGWGHGVSPPLDEKSSVAIRRDVIRAAGNEAPWPEAEDSLRGVMSAISRLSDTPGQSDPEKKELDEGRCDMDPHAKQQVPVIGRKEILMGIALKLREAMRRVAAARGVYHVAIMWFGMAGPAFVERLQARDPLALVLLGHWVVCLKETPHVWWTRGWAEWTVETIYEEIGKGEYGPLMQWPLIEVGLSGESVNRAVSVG